MSYSEALKAQSSTGDGIGDGRPDVSYSRIPNYCETKEGCTLLKIDRTNKQFTALDTPTLADASITERYDLQEYICNSPEAFFEEIGQELFLIAKELLPSKTVQDRIDILALDKQGNSVIVELKRGNHKLHMFQAISYAGMMSQWSSEDVLNQLDEGRQDDLLDFLEIELTDINRQQRIILVAEAYDYALLIGAEWLSEQHGVDVSCCRISLATDKQSNCEYLACSNVYPAPELAQEAIARGKQGKATAPAKWSNWPEALKDISNSALVKFYNQELEAKQEALLRTRLLRYRLDGKVRWHVEARNKRAYVWQDQRFDGDLEFWRGSLSDPQGVQPVHSESCLRLFLHTAEDFVFFKQAVTVDLTDVEWLSLLADGSP